MAKHKIHSFVLAVVLPFLVSQAASAPASTDFSELPGGATWVAEMPVEWNGTLLLFSHGAVNSKANPARNRPRNGGQELLERGYALAGSSYATTGWAVDDAVEDQLATLDAFIARYGKPRKVIAIGESMGGLVSLALVERHGERFDGALPICASVGGALGMMNQALDGAFILSTLVGAPQPFPIVTTGNMPSNEGNAAGPSPEVASLLNKAQSTPEGQARIALAAVIAQLPVPDSAAGSLGERIKRLGEMVPRGIFFPRRDQERRAGGNYSWNTGIDYRAKLLMSGQYAFVVSAYKAAGLDLRKDLDTLANAPRISADQKAVSYMRNHYTPTGRISDPVLTVHEIGDPATMVTYEDGFRDAVYAAGNGKLLRQAYVSRSTHCAFSAAEVVAGVLALQYRIARKHWGSKATARSLNALANLEKLPDARFIEYRPAPFLRACDGKQRRCEGEKW